MREKVKAEREAQASKRKAGRDKKEKADKDKDSPPAKPVIQTKHWPWIPTPRA